MCCTASATLQELKAAVGTGGILPSQQNLLYHICISLCLWHYIKPSKQQIFFRELEELKAAVRTGEKPSDVHNIFILNDDRIISYHCCSFNV